MPCVADLGATLSGEPVLGERQLDRPRAAFAPSVVGLARLQQLHDLLADLLISRRSLATCTADNPIDELQLLLLGQHVSGPALAKYCLDFIRLRILHHHV